MCCDDMQQNRETVDHGDLNPVGLNLGLSLMSDG